ncbi:MAG: energy transducer TonB [Bacteroidota bacterium]
MSAKKKYSSVQEFLRYLKGVISNRERHEFEKDLESDPFAKEALEGLEKLDPDQAEQDLLDLHARLREKLGRDCSEHSRSEHSRSEHDRPDQDKAPLTRPAGKKRINRRRRIAIFSAAAVAASLLIVGTVFLQLYDFSPEQAEETLYEREYPGLRSEAAEEPVQKEAAEPETTAPEGTGPETMAPSAAEKEAAEPEAAAPTRLLQEQAAAPEAADRIIHEEATPTPPVAEKDEAAERKMEAMPAEEQVVETVPAEEQVVEAAPSLEQVMQTGAVEKTARRREGTRSQPVAFQEQDTQRKAMQQKDLADDQELTQQAKGMVAETTGHVVFLDEDLEPIARPVSEPTAEPTAEPRAGEASFPEPSTGYEAFKSYVKANLRFPPEDTLTQKAEVVLQFTVNPEGEIKDIRALSTPGEPFTRQAELLLLEGPSWNPAVDQEVKTAEQVRLKFVFSR